MLDGCTPTLYINSSFCTSINMQIGSAFSSTGYYILGKLVVGVCRSGLGKAGKSNVNYLNPKWSVFLVLHVMVIVNQIGRLHYICLNISGINVINLSNHVQFCQLFSSRPEGRPEVPCSLEKNNKKYSSGSREGPKGAMPPSPRPCKNKS